MRANSVVGTTPAAIYLPRGAEIVELVVVRTGYATASIKVLPDLDKSVLVTLQPLLAKGLRPEGLRPEREFLGAAGAAELGGFLA